MNPQVLKALVMDALYQVFDNWVFRILAVLTAIPILFTVVIQFKPDGMELLFGWKAWEYGDIMKGFDSQGGMGGVDAQVMFVEGFLRLVLGFLGGSIGVLFCIAATAFFVPKMVEKGAADVLFHKPTSRLLLFLSRYLAGLVFVAILSSILVGGVYFGLLTLSQYHDPGILWTAPVMTYMFAIMYAVTMMIGIVTRSTVAAILLTVLFFGLNWVTHTVWHLHLQTTEMTQMVSAEDEEDDEYTTPAFITGLWTTVDFLHYTLPKTGDADLIASKLRRAMIDVPHADRETGFQITSLPDGFEEGTPRTQSIDETTQALLGTARYAAVAGDREIRLWRRDTRKMERERPNGDIVLRTERLREAAESLEAAIASRTGIRDLERTAFNQYPSDEVENELIIPFQNQCVTWKEDAGGGGREIHALLFRAKTWTYTLEFETAEGVDFATEYRDFCGDLSFAVEGGVFERRFAVDAPLRFNILFSIGSSLAFAGVMLLIGWWRLGRIDF